MPLYDYRCHQCGKTFEVIQKFSDDPLTTHEGCGGAVERLISAPALQFKGTGWYVTDYGKGGKSPSTSSSGSSGSGSSSSDSKPAASSETKSESKPAPTASSSDK